MRASALMARPSRVHQVTEADMLPAPIRHVPGLAVAWDRKRRGSDVL